YIESELDSIPGVMVSKFGGKFTGSVQWGGQGSWLEHVSGAGGIMACIPGRNEEIVLFSAHTDSVPFCPGVHDDGVGVALGLELLRAISADHPAVETRAEAETETEAEYESEAEASEAGAAPAHSMYQRTFCAMFNQPEEIGTVGAQAFIATSPVVDKVVAAINVDAAGTGTQEVAFRYSSRTLSQLYADSPSGWISSMMDALAESPLLKSDTDYTILDRAGIPSLDIALATNPWNYHTSRDTTAIYRKDTLVHMGTNILATLRPALSSLVFNDTRLAARRNKTTVFLSLPFGLPTLSVTHKTAKMTAFYPLCLSLAYIIFKSREAATYKKTQISNYIRPIMHSIYRYLLALVAGISATLCLGFAMVKISTAGVDALLSVHAGVYCCAAFVGGVLLVTSLYPRVWDTVVRTAAVATSKDGKEDAPCQTESETIKESGFQKRVAGVLVLGTVASIVGMFDHRYSLVPGFVSVCLMFPYTTILGYCTLAAHILPLGEYLLFTTNKATSLSTNYTLVTILRSIGLSLPALILFLSVPQLIVRNKRWIQRMYVLATLAIVIVTGVLASGICQRDYNAYVGSDKYYYPLAPREIHFQDAGVSVGALVSPAPLPGVSLPAKVAETTFGSFPPLAKDSPAIPSLPSTLYETLGYTTYYYDMSDNTRAFPYASLQCEEREADKESLRDTVTVLRCTVECPSCDRALLSLQPREGAGEKLVKSITIHGEGVASRSMSGANMDLTAGLNYFGDVSGGYVDIQLRRSALNKEEASLDVVGHFSVAEMEGDFIGAYLADKEEWMLGFEKSVLQLPRLTIVKRSF
ncbi:hypothetical protein KIPB_008141, partial [Kipferlia bialata]